MIEIASGIVRSLDVDYNEISWSLASTGEDVLDYDFQVLRSESPEGTFQPVSERFTDRYLFHDGGVASFMSNRSIYYRIAVIHRASGERVDYGPYTNEPEPDLMAAEMRRNLQLLYQEYSGRLCWVLPIRTFGQHCRSCYDPVMKKQIRSRCGVCFDTGFARGYHRPIESYIQIEPNAKGVQPTSNGTIIQSNTTANMVYPTVKPNDVIVEGENRRWQIITVAQTEHVRAGVLQALTLREIDRNDIEYRIPLKLDTALRDLTFAPARNYSNPHDISNFSDLDFANVFGPFGEKVY